jgi:hypothetical protein
MSFLLERVRRMRAAANYQREVVVDARHKDEEIAALKADGKIGPKTTIIVLRRFFDDDDESEGSDNGTSRK